MAREIINEEHLDNVVGGWMHFNSNTKELTYTHEETGAVTKYKIVKYKRAWGMSSDLHSQGLHEDVIIQKMLADGCIS